MSEVTLAVEYQPPQGRRRRVEYRERSVGGHVRVVLHKRDGHWRQVGSEIVANLEFDIRHGDTPVAGRVIADE